MFSLERLQFVQVGILSAHCGLHLSRRLLAHRHMGDMLVIPPNSYTFIPVPHVQFPLYMATGFCGRSYEWSTTLRNLLESLL